MANYLLSYDLSREKKSERVKIFRKLRRGGARLVHHSLWEHSSLEFLTSIALEIKAQGGSAIILEKKLMF